jgi:hypothetical protein
MNDRILYSSEEDRWYKTTTTPRSYGTVEANSYYEAFEKLFGRPVYIPVPPRAPHREVLA